MQDTIIGTLNKRTGKAWRKSGMRGTPMLGNWDTFLQGLAG
jgi:hypothetical protein